MGMCTRRDFIIMYLKALNMKYLWVLSAFVMGMAVSAAEPLFDIARSRPEHYQPLGTGKTAYEIRGDKLLVTIPPAVDTLWPGIIVKPQSGRYFDFSGGSVVAVDVRNLSNRPARLQVEAVTLGSQPGREFDYQVPGGIALNPGETATLRLRYLRAGNFGADWAPDGLQTTFDGFDKRFQHLDVGKVEELRFFIHNNEFEQKFELSGFRLEEPPVPLPAALASAADFYPCIDRFGQYKHADWPGKMKSESDLQKDAAEEAVELDAHPKIFTGRTVYGGWADGPALRATGHFYPAKYKGKWYLVDPSGKLFWSFGLNCITYRYDTGLDLREHYFEWLPGKDDPQFGAFYGIGDPAVNFYKERGLRPKTFDFYRANLIRKYGNRYVEKWAARTIRRLESWGFNTIGSWSADEIVKESRIPYVAQVYAYGAPRLEGDNGFWYKFYEVFDPGFQEALEQNLKYRAEMFNDPYCIGFFVDNEITWGDDVNLASSVLRSPAKQPSKIAFMQFLKKKHGSVSKLNRVWKTDFRSWDGLLESTALPDVRFAGEDMREFNNMLVDRYFKLCRDAVKAVAPGKLYLGCRFVSAVRPVTVRHVAKYADVLSFNYYLYSVGNITLPEGIDKPIIIGEFHFGVPGYGPPHPGLCAVASQADRVRALERYVESALYNPLIVGAHYFRFADEMATGRSFDCENMQTGLVTVTDTPYREMVEGIRELSSRLYEIRAGEGRGQ